MSQGTLMPLQTLDEALEEAWRIASDAFTTYPGAKVFALFSGGNDSTTMLHMARTWIDAAVHVNTGIGIEATRARARQLFNWHKDRVRAGIERPDSHTEPSGGLE